MERQYVKMMEADQTLRHAMRAHGGKSLVHKSVFADIILQPEEVN